MNSNINLIQELNWRGLISDKTPRLNSLISKENDDIFNAFNKFLCIKRLHRLDKLLEIESCH